MPADGTRRVRCRSSWRRTGVLSALGFVAAAGIPAMAAADDGAAARGDTLNETGASFESSITVDGNEVTVTVNASGVAPGLPHAQHIHIPDTGVAVCPSPDADSDGDGIVTTADGVPSYGSVRVSLTTNGDTSASSALAVARFPVADSDGTYEYRRTITVAPDIAARIADGAIVVHGDDLDGSGTYDGDTPSSLDPALPLEATVPAACGEVRAQQYEAAVDGDALNSSGASLDGTVQVDGTMVTVTLRVDGVDADLPHAQHVHIPLGTHGVCPTQSDDPAPGDGVLTTVEGVPFYGSIQLALTT